MFGDVSCLQILTENTTFVLLSAIAQPNAVLIVLNNSIRVRVVTIGFIMIKQNLINWKLFQMQQYLPVSREILITRREISAQVASQLNIYTVVFKWRLTIHLKEQNKSIKIPSFNLGE